MKKTFLYIATALLCISAVSCTEVNPGMDNLPGVDSAVLTTQEEVNSFKGNDHMKSLIIKGEGITDISSLKAKVIDTLAIEHTGIKELNLGNMTEVAGGLWIGNNKNLERLASMTVETVNNLYIVGNPKLSDIIGLLNLTEVRGRVVISGNKFLGKDNGDAPSTYGFNVLKHLIVLGQLDAGQIVLENNHPEAATDPDMIGKLTDSSQQVETSDIPEMIVLNGREEYMSFLKEYERDVPDTVKVFVLNGNGENFSDEDMTLLRDVVGYVSENLVIRSVCGWQTNGGETGLFGSHPNNWRAFSPSSVKVGGGLVISDCPDLSDASGIKCLKDIAGDLIIENCPNINWKDAFFVQLRSVRGTFKLSGIMQPSNTSTFEKLESVGGDLILEDMDNMFYQLNETSSLKTIGGQLRIVGNSYFNNFRGFEKLESVGSIYVYDNNVGLDTQTSLPGFSLIQDLIDKGAVMIDNVDCYYSTGEKVFFFDPENDGGSLPESITIKGRSEFMDFVNTRVREPGSVKYLTIDGNGETISDSEMALIRKRISEVTEDLTVKNVCGWTTNDGEYGVFGADPSKITQYYEGSTKITGSIRFISCPDLAYITGLTCMTTINGDLVVEDCPKVQWNKGAFKNLEEVKGSFIVKNITERANSNTVTKLRKVGGDMILEDLDNWFFQLCEYSYLESVGGQLRIVGNRDFNNFRGFEILQSVGSVYVSGNAAGLDSQSSLPGFSLIQSWIDNGIVTKANVECYKSNGTKVVFN